MEPRPGEKNASNDASFNVVEPLSLYATPVHKSMTKIRSQYEYNLPNEKAGGTIPAAFFSRDSAGTTRTDKSSVTVVVGNRVWLS